MARQPLASPPPVGRGAGGGRCLLALALLALAFYFDGYARELGAVVVTTGGETSPRGRASSSPASSSATSASAAASGRRVADFRVRAPCAGVKSSDDYAVREENGNGDAASVGRFRLPLEEEGRWTLTRVDRPTGRHFVLAFEVLECPPAYMSSAFHVHSVSPRGTVHAGTVTGRWRTADGCGRYNASVPVAADEYEPGGGNVTSRGGGDGEVCGLRRPVAIEAFWTSGHRMYANQMHDVKTSQRIKDNLANLTSDEIAAMLGEDRLAYLSRHLESLPGFPAALELPPPDTVLGDGVSGPPRPLPNCSAVPIDEWRPVGVTSSPDGTGVGRAFSSPNCAYVSYTRDELNYWLAGLRIKYLGDSHGEFENKRVMSVVCPESAGTGDFFDGRYECPEAGASDGGTNNTFAYGWRFFRGMLLPDGSDHDGLSREMRLVLPSSCPRFLGVGLGNVTIVMTPTWLFAYEVDEGLYEYIRALRDVISLCRELHPDEMARMVILLQTPTAADVFPDVRKDDSDEWRANHNFREEAWTRRLREELGGHVDGIIPVFEWTLASNWRGRTSDGVHMGGDYYGEVFHLQVSAILSAMRFGKGWDPPLARGDDPGARWFAGVPLGDG